MERFNFLGTQSTGKTTVLKELQKDPAFEGIEFKTEVVRNLMKSEKIQINESGTIKTQSLIFNAMMEILESKMFFISDRSVLDVFAYTKWQADHNKDATLVEDYDQLVRFQLSYIKDNIQKLGTVFYFPIEFPLVADGVRSVDENYRKEIDNNMKSLLEEFEIEHVIVRGSVEEKVLQIKSYIFE